MSKADFDLWVNSIPHFKAERGFFEVVFECFFEETPRLRVEEDLFIFGRKLHSYMVFSSSD